MKFRDWTSTNLTENIQEGYRNRLSKTALEFKNCKQQLFTLTMCLPARLWGQIARTPFNCSIRARTLLAKCDDYQFQRLILQFSGEGKKISYRKHVHHDASKCWAKRKWLMFCETNHFLTFERIEKKAWKHRAEKYDNQTIKFTHPAVEPTPFYPWVY